MCIYEFMFSSDCHECHVAYRLMVKFRLKLVNFRTALEEVEAPHEYSIEETIVNNDTVPAGHTQFTEEHADHNHQNNKSIIKKPSQLTGLFNSYRRTIFLLIPPFEVVISKK